MKALAWLSGLALLVGGAVAAVDEVPATLVPPVKADALRAVLRELERAGNAVEDRGSDDVTGLKLPTQTLAFWPLLDEVARQSHRQIVPRRGGGAILLVPASGPAGDGPPPVYAGPFRGQIKQLTAQRTFGADEGQRLTVTLELLWEPRLQPLLLRLTPTSVQVESGGRTVASDQGGQVSWRLAGEGGIEIPLRLPLPPRTQPRLEGLLVEAVVLVPPGFLTFSFDAVAPGPPREQAGVRAEILQVQSDPASQRWQVASALSYPRLDLESHQAWAFANVELRLTPKGQGPTIRVRGPREVSVDEGKKVRLTHLLPDLPAPLSDYALSLHPWSQPLEQPLRLRFRNLPLP
jgi:hypothetical protein